MNTPSYYRNQRDEMVGFVPENRQRVLEIGCGAGNFASHFDKSEYWGIEPCDDAAKEATQKLHRVFDCTYESCEQDIPDGYFNVVICNDVIEHLVDPRKFLIGIKRKLQPEGTLVASIPNLRNAVEVYNLIAGDFRYGSSGILDYTHMHLFTMKSFCQMARECEWSICSCTPINQLPFKPVKRMILGLVSKFIPEITYSQFAVTMKPAV